MSWAFLGSYSLKEQINANSANRGDLSSRDSIENESVNHGSNESSTIQLDELLVKIPKSKNLKLVYKMMDENK